MLMADRLDHEKTAAESHYCCDRNIVMSVSNEGKKLMSQEMLLWNLCPVTERAQASRSTQPSSLAAS